MNLKQLIERSKNQDKIDFDKILCAEAAEPLVTMHSTKRLLVEPIWEKLNNDIEGSLYREYIKSHPKYSSVFLRKEVAKRITLVADNLPTRFKLVLRAGHRPITVQMRLLQSLVEEHMVDHPDATKKQALEHARIYVSDPNIKLPPHCCGAAVDVDVLDINTGLLIDFGCPVNTDSEIAFLHSDKVTDKQRKNRLVLLKAMLSAGFASVYSEWWHYSYGDQIWASFYGKPMLLYGIVEPKL